MAMRGAGVRAMGMLLASWLLFGAGTACGADEWRLESHSDHDSVVHVTTVGQRLIAKLGNVASFGKTHSRIALLSLDERKSTTLVIIDMGLKKVAARWPVAARPVSQLSGPTEDVVLSKDSACFAVVRFAADGNSIARNELGGAFDLACVSLADGHLEAFSLPRDMTNPRLAQADGVVYVMNGERGAVWSFDASSHGVTPVEVAKVSSLRLRPSPLPPLNSDPVVVIARMD
jgi:hypothetical protein